MNQKKMKDKYPTEDSSRRLQAILRGAFSGSPTPLKDIPKKSGKSRVTKARSASVASVKTVRRQSGNPA
jgi:hypothetical protein